MTLIIPSAHRAECAALLTRWNTRDPWLEVRARELEAQLVAYVYAR